MLFLLIFAFIGGVVTILSPCILPLLPIILSSTTGGKSKPYGIVTGFIASFTFFTLFLSSIVSATSIDANALRNVSIFIIGFFGISLLMPQTQILLEKLFSRFSKYTPNFANKQGFWGGIIIGLSLGLLWTPCVGPILASVITLAITGSVSYQAFLITLAYSIGTAIPMLIIIKNGNKALTNVPWLVRNSANIQKIFGILMILTAVAIYFNIDRKFQNYILTKFPQYGAGLTSLEDNTFVQEGLNFLMKDSIGDTLPSEMAPLAPEIKPTGEWFNSSPLTIAELAEQDKVVLIDFWTYTCINCIRTFPYLDDWWSKYEDDGLVIIGVHTPEFEFEKSAENVATAIKDFDIKYPVVQDNDFLTWRAYGNRYWPAKYLIDKDGRIRYSHFGEGDYAETETVIQELLSETGADPSEEIDANEYSLEERSPETYFGYQRLSGSLTSEDIVEDEFTEYTTPSAEEGVEMPLNYPGFVGEWKITEEYSESKSGSSIMYGFKAKDVYAVMRSEEPTTVNVYLDGELIKTVTVNSDKLYDLVNLEEYGTHVLWLEFEDDGTEIYTFTFG